MEWVSEMYCNGPEITMVKLIDLPYLKSNALELRREELPFEYLIMENSKFKLESNHSHPINYALLLRRC
jgi:hypothetical protein